MGLVVEVSGSAVRFENFKFDNENNCFHSSSLNPFGLSMKATTHLSNADAVEIENYLVFFFIKKDLVENEIFQVHDGKSGNRIGWCFPVHSIDSSDHDYAENPHFRRYAFAATLKILNDLPSEVFLNTPTTNEFSIQASDALHESTAALVISKNTLGREFEIDRWLPTMAANGYFPLSSVNPNLLQTKHPRIDTEKVRLLEVSLSVVQLERLKLVYSQAFPYEPKAVFRFFYLYQIVEHLMEIVFTNEQAILVTRIIAAADDTSTTKEVLEGMSKNSSEKSRMKLMVGKYSNTNSDLSSLMTSCNTLLDGLGKKKGNTFENTIYPTRNQIVHRLIDFPESQLSNMENMITELVIFLQILLAKFAIPSNTEKTIN